MVNVPWNKGLTKETDERVKKYSKTKTNQFEKSCKQCNSIYSVNLYRLNRGTNFCCKECYYLNLKGKSFNEFNQFKKGQKFHRNFNSDHMNHKKHIYANGYLEFNYKRKAILEHHYIWLRDNPYGIPLIPDGWIVHHRNGKKKDNRIENLIIMPKKIHTAMHNQLRNGGEIRW